MAGDLSDLFEGVDGLAEDLMEYGVMAGAAVAANVGFNYAVGVAMDKFGTNLPAWVSKYAVPGAAIALGGVGLPYAASRYGFQGSVATGAGVGLMLAGINRLLKAFAPAFALGAMEDDSLMLGPGQGGDLFDRYLGQGSTTVEQMNGLGSATMSIEQMNGLGGFGGAPVTVETVDGYFGGNLAASLQ